MSEVYNVYQAKTHLSELLDRAAAGEEIILAKAGKEKAMLVPLPSAKKKPAPKRVPGRLKGKIWVAPDAFSRETDAAIWNNFYTSDVFPPAGKKA